MKSSVNGTNLKFELSEDFDAEEFLRDTLGAKNITRHNDELIHSCLLPFGLHRNGDRNPSASLNEEKFVYNCFSCLSGETRVLTINGWIPIKDAVGMQTLLTTNGRWVQAPISSFGTQRLMKLTLTRNGVTKVIYTTEDHRWLLQVGHKRTRSEAITRELLPGHRLAWSVPQSLSFEDNREAIQHGFVYGDGTRQKSVAAAYFNGEKDNALLQFFDGVGTIDKRGVRRIGRLPGYFKDLPDDVDDSYLFNWLRGYFAADGCVDKNGQVILSSANKKSLEFVFNIAPRLGIGTFDIGVQMRKGLLDYETPLYHLRFMSGTLNSSFFILPKHRRRFQTTRSKAKYRRLGWTVRSVEWSDRVEEVFCATVPETHSFVIEGNILTGNCGGGSLLWATQNILQISRDEALRILQARVSPSNFSTSRFIEQLEKLWNDEVEDLVLPRYSVKMLEPWLCYSEYLDNRGVSREIQKLMRTGINFDNMDQYSGGWITQPRLVIPHFFEGELRGWSMRKLISEQVGPKYKHTPSFPKDHTLFNFDKAKSHNIVYLVESPLSVLVMMSQGIQNVVATFGAAVTNRQVEIMRRFERVIVFPDGDKAGYSALLKPKFGLADRLSKFTDVWVVDHGIEDDKFNRKDPADYDDILNVVINKKVPLGLIGRTYNAIQQVHEGKD